MNTAKRTVNGNLLPLRFKRHNFEANCYNAQRYFVVYNGSGFLHQYKGAPAPSDAEYRKCWGLASYLGVSNSAAPAKVKWTSLDGVDHEAVINMRDIFRDEIVLHNVPDEELPDGIFEQGLITGTGICLEVNDHTLSVYFMVYVPTKSEQIPGNKYSHHRTELLMAWTKTY